eukprot:scaffold30018_cov18-Tisochrysis_lutea.AAC.2
MSKQSGSTPPHAHAWHAATVGHALTIGPGVGTMCMLLAMDCTHKHAQERGQQQMVCALLPHPSKDGGAAAPMVAARGHLRAPGQ